MPALATRTLASLLGDPAGQVNTSASGSNGAHGAAVTVPAPTAAAQGSNGAHGQCLTVSARASTTTVQTGTHGQAIATSGDAFFSASTGQGGAEGQCVTTMRTMTLVPGSLATLGAGI